MKLKLGDIWISDTHPHESFEIYDGEIDSWSTDIEIKECESFDKQHEGVKIFFWRRYDIEAYNNWLDEKLGINRDSSYPYVNCGECKKAILVNKIKKFNMKLIN